MDLPPLFLFSPLSRSCSPTLLSPSVVHSSIRYNNYIHFSYFSVSSPLLFLASPPILQASYVIQSMPSWTEIENEWHRFHSFHKNDAKPSVDVCQKCSVQQFFPHFTLIHTFNASFCYAFKWCVSSTAVCVFVWFAQFYHNTLEMNGFCVAKRDLNKLQMLSYGFLQIYHSFSSLSLAHSSTNNFLSRVDAAHSESLATIVYIHGESYEWNSGNPYDGSILAAHGNVIVVTINFRLGVLGKWISIGCHLSQTNYNNNEKTNKTI